MGDINQWQWPKNVAGKLIGWSSDGARLENKDAPSSDAYLLDRANHTGTQLANTISDFSTAADARVSAAIGSTVQAYSAALTAIAALTPTDSNFIVGNGTTWVVESGGTVRTSLGLGTGDSPQFTGIELGNATDTTLTRGAAGFVAVEGKRVPSPASQASGDILYRGSTEWERLAKGTAGQVLVMNAGATAPEWGTAGSWTELSPVNTTSGTSVTLASSIPSGVRDIELWFDLVSTNSTAALRLQATVATVAVTTGYTSGSGTIGSTVRITDTSGYGIYTNVATGQNTGVLRLHRSTGNTWVSEHSMVFDIGGGGVGAAGGGVVALAGALDGLVLTTATGTPTFDAGSVQVRYR
jgi:hypothetical protein